MIEHNEERERRIQDEAIVDAYGSEEQALGWYYDLEERIIFPFKARCLYSHKTSLLGVLGDSYSPLPLADDWRLIAGDYQQKRRPPTEPPSLETCNYSISVTPAQLPCLLAACSIS
ncbi:MAG: calcium-binding protein [Chloroflexi bacterium]|nr:calcium-binding protein [Chloroflexota bacterium]